MLYLATLFLSLTTYASASSCSKDVFLKDLSLGFGYDLVLPQWTTKFAPASSLFFETNSSDVGITVVYNPKFQWEGKNVEVTVDENTKEILVTADEPDPCEGGKACFDGGYTTTNTRGDINLYFEQDSPGCKASLHHWTLGAIMLAVFSLGGLANGRMQLLLVVGLALFAGAAITDGTEAECTEVASSQAPFIIKMQYATVVGANDGYTKTVQESHTLTLRDYPTHSLNPFEATTTSWIQNNCEAFTFTYHSMQPEDGSSWNRDMQLFNKADILFSVTDATTGELVTTHMLNKDKSGEEQQYFIEIAQQDWISRNANSKLPISDLGGLESGTYDYAITFVVNVTSRSQFSFSMIDTNNVYVEPKMEIIGELNYTIETWNNRNDKIKDVEIEIINTVNRWNTYPHRNTKTCGQSMYHRVFDDANCTTGGQWDIFGQYYEPYNADGTPVVAKIIDFYTFKPRWKYDNHYLQFSVQDDTGQILSQSTCAIGHFCMASCD